MSRDFQEVRREILAMYERVQNETYYQILGVDQEADQALINGNYRNLAKTWHIDRFSAYDLGEERSKVQEIFAFINNAHRTLLDADSRDEYDMEINDGPDLVDLLNAESAFRSGKNMLERGSYKGAFQMFSEAYNAHPDEVEYEAYYIYSEFLMEKKDEKGRVTNKARTIQIFARLDEIHQNINTQKKDWLLTFMGTVALGLGKDREAVGLFRESLYINSQNHEAKRQLRLLEIRQRKKKKGFFEKIMDNFKSK